MRGLGSRNIRGPFICVVKDKKSINSNKPQSIYVNLKAHTAFHSHNTFWSEQLYPFVSHGGKPPGLELQLRLSNNEKGKCYKRGREECPLTTIHKPQQPRYETFKSTDILSYITLLLRLTNGCYVQGIIETLSPPPSLYYIHLLKW